MIETAFTDRVFYRMHNPRWAFAPTSGAGAARQGGRVNRPGVEALYLAGEASTAIEEYRQLSTLLSPCTLVSYLVTLNKVVDFSGGYTTAWDPLWEDFFCDWRKMAFADKVEPPSWVLADQVQAAGFKGVLFPSAVSAGGINMVVFTSALLRSDKVEVVDPDKDLPKTQASWT